MAHVFLRLPLAVRAGAYALCWALVMVFNSGGAKGFICFSSRAPVLGAPSV
ncbi:MAG: hypothetical protein Q7I92_00340 [Humidesulfovibrio sp.]|nr:hypothetical protein [Humidesulfovibrio sp.]